MKAEEETKVEQVAEVVANGGSEAAPQAEE